MKREVFYFGGVGVFSIKTKLGVLALGPRHSSEGDGMVVDVSEGEW